MNISTLLPQTDEWFEKQSFHIFLETHLSLIKEKYIIDRRPVSADLGAKYQGDFFGLLGALGIPFGYHYIVLRVNGFSSSGEYSGESMSVLLPSQDEIDAIRTAYKTKQKG